MPRVLPFAAVIVAVVSACAPPECKSTDKVFTVDGATDSVGGVHVTDHTSIGGVISLSTDAGVTISFRPTVDPALPDPDTALALDVSASALYVRLSDADGPIVEGGKSAIVDKKLQGASELDGALAADPDAPVTSCTQTDEKGASNVSAIDATFHGDGGDVRVAIDESHALTIGGVSMMAVSEGGEAGSTVGGSACDVCQGAPGLHTFREVRGYAYRVP